MNHKDVIGSIGLVLRDVVTERLRQEQKWGPQNHRQMVWLGILAEEFGEAAKEVNEFHFREVFARVDAASGEKTKTVSEAVMRARIREELVQTAAVAVAMIESLDRNGR